MTREQKIARARELREQGNTYAAIGRELGHTGNLVRRWLNPDLVREYSRRSNGKRGAQKRAWENAYDRRPCACCGKPRGAGSHRGHGYDLCTACCFAKRRAERDERRQRIADMWNAGREAHQIAGALDSTANTIYTELNRMRKAGWDVPPHYAGNRNRVAA